MSSNSSLTESLHEKTIVFGLKLWVVIGIAVGASLLGILLILLICLTIQSCIRRSRKPLHDRPMTQIPPPCKDIKEVSNDFVIHDGLLLTIQNEPEPGDPVDTDAIQLTQEEKLKQGEENNLSGSFRITDGCDGIQIVSLDEQSSTHATDNVIGEGGYGVVYRGRLSNGTPVAVKKILNNLGQAEREFRVEVEAIGHVRHKNLVRLLGYCVEGTQRMLVYEYVNNGNLESWLHGELSQYSSLTWLARMKILLGTAKALAYLHEAIEPKVVHRDIKSSNILIDDEFNAKISDFGLAKMLGAGKSHIATRVMGTFGYVAPEYANSGLLNEKSDVYSFGVVLLEAITGRDPIDYERPPNEVNLVDWLKMMVANRRSEEVVDPNLERRPSTKELKRALLTALRCIDLNAEKRPSMDQVVRMLDSNEPIPQEERRHRQNRTPESSETEPLRGKNNSGRSDAPEHEARPPRPKSRTFSSK
ncbi:hypothetical protein PVAP13_3KG086500 [Panicum virgatum]|uniref:non-specific serine/threonine protein kinase n=1 Tax=Panicum virgatum TaxID=38727 RepID=A0A8T0USY1_PANVG|nr:hypothetical protein PVAP13_3KG086500 [Panicum virgatum]